MPFQTADFLNEDWGILATRKDKYLLTKLLSLLLRRAVDRKPMTVGCISYELNCCFYLLLPPHSLITPLRIR